MCIRDSYCGIEKFEYGRGYNIAVSIYDAETLKWKRDLPWSPESGQVEVSGLAVDREKNMVWMSDWVDSRYVYCYSLETGQYYTKMPVSYTHLFAGLCGCTAFGCGRRQSEWPECESGNCAAGSCCPGWT